MNESDVMSDHVENVHADAPPPRRPFLKFVTATLGGFLALGPAVAALLPVLDPIRRGGGSTNGNGEGEWFPVATLDGLPDDGSPRQFPVFADKVDAWNVIRNTRVGAVYLKRHDDGTVSAWNTVCPHAGCYVSAKKDGSFLCPCHDSEFEPDGSVRPTNAHGQQTKSPRDLDSLDAKVDGATGRVLVRFKNFRAAIPQKDAIPQSIRPPQSA